MDVDFGKVANHIRDRFVSRISVLFCLVIVLTLGEQRL